MYEKVDINLSYICEKADADDADADDDEEEDARDF